MTSNSSRPPPHIGTVELDIASTLINEANALLRQHGEDPGNDGTGDDLPVLTEVIFDLGDTATPPAPAAPQPAAAQPRSKPVVPATTAPVTATQPAKPPSPTATLRPQSTAPTPTATMPTPAAQSPRPQAGAIPPRPQTAPRIQTAVPTAAATASNMPSQKPQAVGVSPAPRPATARAQNVADKPSPGLQPPRGQIEIPAQRPAAPPVRAATSTTVAAPSPQAGSAARLPSMQSLSQSEEQTARPQPVPPDTPATAPVAKPQNTAAVRPSAAPIPPAAKQPPPLDSPAPNAQAITEKLKLLDTLIIGEVEAWLREELPALVVREISRLNERLRTEAVNHLHATLLPRISEHISKQIKHASSANPGGRPE